MCGHTSWHLDSHLASSNIFLDNMLRRIATTSSRRAFAPRITNSIHPRPFSIATPRMAAFSLPAVSPPVSTALPSDAFQLLPENQKAGAAEDALYERQLKDVEAWWASPRYEGIKRPYSAADVVSKRGSQQQSYPSSVMARKLFNLIKEREPKGEPIHTSLCSLQTCKKRPAD